MDEWETVVGIIKAIMPADFIPEFLCAFLIELLQPVESTAQSHSKEENLFSYYFIYFNELLMKN